MLGKAKKRANRIGFVPVKVHFSVQTESVNLPFCCLVADQAILSICFERKSKSVSTGKFIHTVSLEKGDNLALVRENLELVALLHKDIRTGKYQKKTGKLVLKELSKQGLFGQFGYKVLGRCDLNLHEIANEIGCELSTKRCGIVIFENLKGVVLKFSVTATIQDVNVGCLYAQGDDNSSVMSDVSDISELTSATLNLPPLSAPVFHPALTLQSSYLDSASSNHRASSTPACITEEEDPLSGSGANSLVAGEANPTSSNLTSSPILRPTALIAGSADFTATRSVFELLEKELHHRGEHVSALERQLAIQSVNVTKFNTSVKLQQLQPQDDDHSRNSEDALELAASAVVECSLLREELQLLTQALTFSRDSEERLRAALDEEMRVVQEAAAIAASTSVMRAEVEDECQMLLSQLINMKLEKANMSMQLDLLSQDNRSLSMDVLKLKAVIAASLR